MGPKGGRFLATGPSGGCVAWLALDRGLRSTDAGPLALYPGPAGVLGREQTRPPPPAGCPQTRPRAVDGPQSMVRVYKEWPPAKLVLMYRSFPPKAQVLPSSVPSSSTSSRALVPGLVTEQPRTPPALTLLFRFIISLKQPSRCPSYLFLPLACESWGPC